MRIRPRYRRLQASRIVCMILARMDREAGRPYEHHVSEARRINRTMVRIQGYCNIRKPTPAERLANAAWLRMTPQQGSN